MSYDLTLKLKMLWLHRGSFGEWRRDVWQRDASERLCCDGYMCGCQGSDYGSFWEHCWKTRKVARPWWFIS